MQPAPPTSHQNEKDSGQVIKPLAVDKHSNINMQPESLESILNTLEQKGRDAEPAMWNDALKRLKNKELSSDEKQLSGISEKLPTLATQYLLKRHRDLDSETGLALLQVALDKFQQTIRDAESGVAKAIAIMRLAPAWNSAMKQLKEKSDSMSEGEQKKIVEGFTSIRRAISECPVDDRARLLSGLLDGIKTLGQIKGALHSPAGAARLIALLAPEEPNYEAHNEQRRSDVLKANLAAFNDPMRLQFILSVLNETSIPWLSRLLSDVDLAAPAISLAQELDKLRPEDLAQICASLNGYEELTTDEKRRAVSMVDELAARMLPAG
jgi:hypothetical protein